MVDTLSSSRKFLSEPSPSKFICMGDRTALCKESSYLLQASQLSRARGLATVTDDPLDKKVEMTNWEKVGTNNHIHGFYGRLLKLWKGMLKSLIGPLH